MPGEDCKTKSFMICTPHPILFGLIKSRRIRRVGHVTRTYVPPQLRNLDLLVTLIPAVGPLFEIPFCAFFKLCFSWLPRSVSLASWASKYRFWGFSFPLIAAKVSWLINLCVPRFIASSKKRHSSILLCISTSCHHIHYRHC